MIICESSDVRKMLPRASLVKAGLERLLTQAMEPGVTTAELDPIADRYIRSCNTSPTIHGYSASHANSASVNDKLVHGIPDIVN